MNSIPIDIPYQNYINECNRKLNRKNSDSIGECLALVDKIKTLKRLGVLHKVGDNQFYPEKGMAINSPPFSLKMLAAEQGYSKRCFTMKKFIGEHINKTLIHKIKSNPKINKITILYKLAKLSERRQAKIMELPFEKIQEIFNMNKKSMLQEEASDDKISVNIDKHIYNKALKYQEEGELPLNQDLEFYLLMKAREKARARNNKSLQQDKDIMFSMENYY